jgi:hypothetical protein
VSLLAGRPNGRRAGGRHYAHKLAFLDAMRAHAAQEAQALSDVPLGLLGGSTSRRLTPT